MCWYKKQFLFANWLNTTQQLRVSQSRHNSLRWEKEDIHNLLEKNILVYLYSLFILPKYSLFILRKMWPDKDYNRTFTTKSHIRVTRVIVKKKLISILEWFLKDHVTRQTGGMADENSALPSQQYISFQIGKYYNKLQKYCNLKYYWFLLHFFM